MLFVLLAACSDPATTPAPTTDGTPNDDPSQWPTTVGGDRPARVVAPVGTWDGEPLPVLLMLHGYDASALLQDVYLAMSPEVPERGFVLILPDGTEDSGGSRFWNATDFCCDFDRTGVDDVAYLSSLLDEVEAGLPVDRDRVSVFGHSNGGFMAWRLACETPERFSAVASLAGATFFDPADCAHPGPVAALQLHGDLDDTILYDGFPAAYPSAEETVSRAAELAGCEPGLVASGTADHDALVDGAETDLLGFAGCERDVALWRMNGSGHIPIVTETWRDDLLTWSLGQRRP